MKRRWTMAAAFLATLLAAHGAVWWVAGNAVAQRFAAWQAVLAAQGWRVAAGPPAHGGWPLAATRVYPDVSIAAGSFVLRLPQLAVSVSPLHADTVRFTLPEPANFSGPGLWPLRFAAPAGQFEAPLQGAPWLAFDASDWQAELAQPGGPPRLFGAGLTHLRLDPAPGRLVLGFSAQAITLPEPRPGEMLPLGPRLASLSGDAVLRGAPDPSRLDAGGLAGWRDAGGGLQVQRLAVGYGPLGLSADGRLGLDGGLQPAGGGMLHILGYAETLRALEAGRVIDSHQATALGAALALLAHPPEGGGAPVVDAAIALSGQVLSVAGFPLLRLPRLDLPPGA